MSTLLYGMMRDPTPVEEGSVRDLSTPYIQDAPIAEEKGAPEFNEVETYENPLIGMHARRMAPDWTEGDRHTPVNPNYAGGAVDARINAQVATSGTAANRELSGQGPRTLSYAYGIEPVIRDGSEYGNEYFERDDRGIQDTASTSMESPVSDGDVAVRVGATGKSNSRQAYNGAYAAWFANEGRI